MFHLLELYATMPETKTVAQRISVSPDASDPAKATKKTINGSQESKSIPREEDEDCVGTPVPPLRDVGMLN